MVWGNEALNKGNQKKPNSIQRLGLIMIAPVRQSTPTKALELIYNVPLLYLHIKSLALGATLRENPK